MKLWQLRNLKMALSRDEVTGTAWGPSKKVQDQHSTHCNAVNLMMTPDARAQRWHLTVHDEVAGVV